MNIFRNTAPLLWEHGLPALPLRGKRPLIDRWSDYCSVIPDPSTREAWLSSYPTANVGLALGPASGMCMIDIDTVDEDLTAAILGILPNSPWVRVGKKGMAVGYQFEGQKNFKIGDPSGMILEFLGAGNQVVLPPSIHPDCAACGMRDAAGPAGVSTCCGTANIIYHAEHDLWDVRADCPPLGGDIEEKLRALLSQKGIQVGTGGRSSPIDIVPAGDRDQQMVRHAGYLARVVLGIDRSAQFSLMDALAQMYHWAESFTAKVAGDDMDPNKGVAKLLEFMLKDLKKGRVPPPGWDADLTDEVRAHPIVAEIMILCAGTSWSLARMIDELRTRADQKPGDDLWVDEVAGEIVREAASDPTISEYDVRCFHDRLLGAYGSTVKWGALKQVFKSSRQRRIDGASLDDHHAVASAVLEDLERAGEIRFDHMTFWQWGGSCWSALHEDDIYMHVAANVKGSTIVRRDNDYLSIVRLLRRQCRSALATSNLVGVNFANGFVTDELELLPHSPEHGCTFTLPFNYDAELSTKCAGWLRFLESCWGQADDFEDRVLALQEAFAATIFKVAPEYQKAFLLFGAAGAGKSQVLEVLRGLLPASAVASIGPEIWGERFHLTHLIGTAANLCGELPEQGRIKGSVFKQVVEGSSIYTEYKAKDGFSFEPQCAHWFASNFLPISPDSSRGFTRRWLVFDFDREVPDDEKVPDLAGRLISEERAEIAAWALAGIARLRQQEGYTEPASHLQRVQGMRRLNNSVLAFLEDSGWVHRTEGTMHVRELYELYSSHMKGGGYGEPVRYDRFRLMLEELGHAISSRRDVFGCSDDLVHGVHKIDAQVRAKLAAVG